MTTTTKRREKFEQIVQKAETEFQKNPNAYKSKLRKLAFLGYGYMFFILLLCLAVIAVTVILAIHTSWFWVLLIKKKLIIVVLFVMYVIFKSLFIKIPAPEGYKLKKEQAPDIFKHLKQMQKQLKTPKIHEVVISQELNAAIQQTPRLGIFGWHKNTLILGSELLMVLNEKETLSVIAHEMGHLSGGHARFNGWIYRVRMSWMNIMYTMEQLQGIAGWMFGKFFNWYAPYFSAYSFALARSNEFEADQTAIQITSEKDFSEGLTKVFVFSEMFSSPYWDTLHKKSLNQKRIEKHVFTDYYTSLKDFNPDSAKVAESISDNMKTKTGYDDTHPSLSDRLQAFSIQPEFIFDFNDSAANKWFKDSWHNLLTELDKSWAKNNRESWRYYYTQGQEAAKRLIELDKDKLNTDEMVEKANIIAYLYGRDKAIPVFKKIFEEDKSNPHALYNLGTALIENKNEKGLIMLHKLMENEDYIYNAGDILYNYYYKNNQPEKATDILKKMENQQDNDVQFYNELNSISVNDNITEPQLNEEEKPKIDEVFAKCGYFSKSWLAQKQLPSHPDRKLYVILYKPHNEDDHEKLFNFFQKFWPIDGYFILVSQENAKVAKHIKKVAIRMK